MFFHGSRNFIEKNLMAGNIRSRCDNSLVERDHGRFLFLSSLFSWYPINETLRKIAISKKLFFIRVFPHNLEWLWCGCEKDRCTMPKCIVNKAFLLEILTKFGKNWKSAFIYLFIFNLIVKNIHIVHEDKKI